MIPASALTDAETARLAALRSLGILDSLPEPVFDDVVRLAAQICGTPIGLVSLVDVERQWFKARTGLVAPETRRDLAFCAHAIAGNEPLLVVEDAALDPRFADNALVTGEPHIRFYAGAVIHHAGQALGTVCVIDTVPRRLEPAQVQALQALARQVNALFELRHKSITLERVSAQAAQEREHSAELLELVLRGGNLGLWDLHVPTGDFSINRREHEMLGYSATEATPERLQWYTLVHPDDWPLLNAAMAPHLRGQTAHYECEHRMRHRDGHWVWVMHRAVAVERDPDGAPVRFVGTHMDISEQVQSRQTMLETRQRLRMVTDNLPALVTQVDAEQRYRFANAHAWRVVRRSPQEMLGRTMREVWGEVLYAELQPQVEAALRGEATTFATTVDVDGISVHYQSNFIPEVDARGRVTGFYAMTFDITELQESQKKLETLVRFDSLTGLPNRRHFDERIEEAMNRTRRTGRAMAVLYLDIDHFKAINDSHGHAAGDAVLREVAQRLKACVRTTDTVARLSGDEFVLLLESSDGRADYAQVAEKIVACLRPPIRFGNAVLHVTASAGLSVFTRGGGMPSAAELLSRADRALYGAKGRGRDQVVAA